MASDAPSSTLASPHVFIGNVSSLFGLVIFLQQMWSGAALNHVLLTAATSGFVTYLALLIGYVGVQRILAQAPPPDSADDASVPTTDQTEEDVETDTPEHTSESQAA